MQFYYLFILIIFGLILTGIYIVKYRNIPLTVWKPKVAWIRALIYFVLCNCIAVITGTLDKVLTQPIATPAQLIDPIWWFFCLGCFIYIFIAYWILWARLTLTFNRKYYLGWEIIFGILWGASTGQVLLSFYHLWSQTSLQPWLIYILSYICMGAWQYFVHDYFWDVYVSPEHDTPRSILLKTLISHIPNVAICLAFLITYDNYLLYVFSQIFGLVAASIYQRFPSPWANGTFTAPRTKPGLFRLPHGVGYIVDKQK